jgi:anti-sigma factor RsiW
MKRCGISPLDLMAWMDGEACSEDAVMKAHVNRCEACRAEVAAWTSSGRVLKDELDAELGPVDELSALRAIRRRIANARDQSLWGRLNRRVADVWLFHRRAVAGVVVAAALGCLTAPALVWWLGQLASRGSHFPLAAVVVESVEVGNDATAVVLQKDGATTTLIWIEPVVGDVDNAHRP